jgi:ABC-type antimicrobial peptide transport system permease subunit
LTVPAIHVLIRSRADAGALASTWRDAVRSADAKLAGAPLVELADRVVTLLARPRLYALLLTSFAVSALAIAAVGVFGMLTYSVAQRARELAVRAALGATGARLRLLILRQAVIVVGAGVGIGLTASALLSPLLAALLYGVVPLDRWTYVVVPATIVGIALIACAGPAWRASRIDPIVELRRG